MIQADLNRQYEQRLNFVEYLASFWNAEAVEKIRLARDTDGDSRFMSKDEFEKRIEDGQIISSEVLEQIQKKYENTNYNTSNSHKNPGDRMRLPQDFDGLKDIIKK
mgnify:CR=1 FL=1|tara:strand:- start:6615 stop:6932 length:318 start_codon:yes stop_codon:yes gene_type:complete